MKTLHILLLLCAGGLCGAVADTAFRDYAVERKVSETGKLVEDTIRQCDENRDKMISTFITTLSHDYPTITSCSMVDPATGVRTTWSSGSDGQCHASDRP